MTRVIKPESDSRLAQLAAQYDLAKAESAKAAEALKAITDAIKIELTHAAPGESDVQLDSPDLIKPLRLTAVESWRIDAKKLKAEDSLTYVRYAVQSTTWRLAPVSS